MLTLGDLGETDLEGAVDEIVGVLNRDDARQAMVVGSLEESHQAPRRLVREPNESDLALISELGERAKNLGDWMRFALEMHVFEALKHPHRPVRPVELIKVDVIGLEPLETCFDGLPDLHRT